MNQTFYIISNDSDLQHHGILGMKWGVRRYQNPDGTLTDAGKRRYGKDSSNKLDKITTAIHERNKNNMALKAAAASKPGRSIIKTSGLSKQQKKIALKEADELSKTVKKAKQEKRNNKQADQDLKTAIKNLDRGQNGAIHILGIVGTTAVGSFTSGMARAAGMDFTASLLRSTTTAANIAIAVDGIKKDKRIRNGLTVEGSKKK